VYPDRKNLADALQIGNFDTLQECGIAAVKTLDSLDALEQVITSAEKTAGRIISIRVS